MELINQSQYAAGIFVDTARDGADTLVLVVKATFDIGLDGSLIVSKEQRDIDWGDVYAGEPGQSSVLYEADATWGRTGTDVAFAGYAHPKRLGDRQVDVGLRIGHMGKTARVFGDRYWESTLGVFGPSLPEPFERVPMVWERSFGGVDLTLGDQTHREQEARNPVGCGFRAKGSQMELHGAPLPNIEDPRHLISGPADRPSPVGFGFVAKSWMPRVAFAGTYDDRWQQTRAPLLPDDYNPRFTVAASEGLWAPNGLRGGEIVDLVQLTPNGRLVFVLPTVHILGSYLASVPPINLAMGLVVVFIDGAHMKLTLVWQGSAAVHGLIDEIRWVRALDESQHVATFD